MVRLAEGHQASRAESARTNGGSGMGYGGLAVETRPALSQTNAMPISHKSGRRGPVQYRRKILRLY